MNRLTGNNRRRGLNMTHCSMGEELNTSWCSCFGSSWMQRGAGKRSKVFVGLDAEDDELVGTASRLLAQQQPGGQAGRLAGDREVVCSPRLAVFVHHPEPPAGGAMPDAFLRPDRRRGTCYKRTNADKSAAELQSHTRRGQITRPGHQRSRWVS